MRFLAAKVSIACTDCETSTGDTASLTLFTLLIGMKARRLLRDQWDRRDPAGALALRRLTARPAESEAPGMEINRPIREQTKKD
ncbi:hypothetical protein A3781_03290 [Bacillus badius]|nr:hypothetical protein A3781_03290 [Bacillus badius]